jgi:hypothetical protein
MLGRAQGHTIVAGTGVSVSLLAAVATVVALVAGILGFNAWPGAARSGADGALSVLPAAVHGPAIRPLALPAPAGSARAGRAGRAARLVPAGRPGRRAARGGPATPADRGSSTSPAPASTTPARTMGGALAPAGKAVISGADTAAGTLGSAGGQVTPAAPVLTTVAGAVTGTGQAVAGVVSRLGPQ